MASPVEILLRDPLTEVTRKERRILLGTCAIAFTTARTGLVPSKISALGVDFTAGDQKSLLSIMALVITYFLIAFLTYAIADFVAWRVAFHSAVRELAKSRLEERTDPAAEARARAIRDEMQALSGRSYLWGSMSRPVSILRALLDCAVPVAVGIATIAILLRTEVPAKAANISLQPAAGTQRTADIDARRAPAAAERQRSD